MRAVVTVTLNPAIDRTVWVDHLEVGGTQRTADTRVTIGGKGINVARTVARLGVIAFAMGVAGEDQAPAIERHLSSLGVRSRFLATPGETRTNLKLIERDGRLTEINGNGPPVSAELLDAFEEELLAVIDTEHAGTVVLAGSLPPGVDPGVYARLTRRIRDLRSAILVLVDTSDLALASVVAAEPFLVKPNRLEAEALLGRTIGSVEEARQAAGEIARLGPRGVLLSLGRLGAVAAWDGSTEVLAAAPIQTRPGRLLTTVGAGDAMVARVAADLARRDGRGQLGGSEFYAMCRDAVDQAAMEIGQGLVDEPAREACGPDGAARVGSPLVHPGGESEEPMAS